jgi:beta-lactam-binding protein with PASTA domain
VANDVIIGQSPASGITVHKGDTVSFRVSKGREPFPVPNVVGKTLSEAQSVISAGNLAASEGSRQWSETVPEGSVISQEPSGGTLYRNGAVSLVVSKGREPWTVANYVGQQISSVRPAMENFGLSVSVTEFYSDTVPAGQISAQNPSAGPILYKGGSISFEVSRGPETRVVPTVTGSNYTSAQSALQGADLAVTIDSSHSSSVARGNVISQNPAAGASVRKGSAVTITVSRGVADSGWVDSLPSGVDTGGYDIQERTVWRYRDQKDEGGWGSWSGWSANAVSASGTRQVETRWIEPTYKTIWHYERWKYWNSAAGRYESGAGSSWTDGYPSTYEEIWLEYALNHTGTLDSGRKRYGSHGEPSIIRDWWWNENSYQEIATPGRTEYHYRDWIPKLTWGNWSSWSTTQVTASGTRQVESATQYMYSGKPIP